MTYDEASNPLNTFFKKEIKKQNQQKNDVRLIPGVQDQYEVITDQHQQLASIDQN